MKENMKQSSPEQEMCIHSSLRKRAADMSIEEVVSILSQREDLAEHISAIERHALDQMLEGVRYPGFKVVAGKARRKFCNEEKVAAIVTAAGFSPFKKKLLNVSEMIKLLGSERFNELLGDLVEITADVPHIVPESDKRPAIDLPARAGDDK